MLIVRFFCVLKVLKMFCVLFSDVKPIKFLVFFLGRRHRLDNLIPRSPTPPALVRERQLSVSSRSSLTSEAHQRRKIEVESPQEYIPTPASPTYPEDFEVVDRKKRKKKEKKHKKEKKNKKKKKKKHRSRSTSPESGGSESDKSQSSSVKRTPPNLRKDVETLSDWENPEHVKAAAGDHKIGIDTSACSPVSNDSEIGSPEPPVYEVRSPTPPLVTPPAKPFRGDYYTAKESPHTPPIHHTNRYSIILSVLLLVEISNL